MRWIKRVIYFHFLVLRFRILFPQPNVHAIKRSNWIGQRINLSNNFLWFQCDSSEQRKFKGKTVKERFHSHRCAVQQRACEKGELEMSENTSIWYTIVVRRALFISPITKIPNLSLTHTRAHRLTRHFQLDLSFYCVHWQSHVLAWENHKSGVQNIDGIWESRLITFTELKRAEYATIWFKQANNAHISWIKKKSTRKIICNCIESKERIKCMQKCHPLNWTHFKCVLSKMHWAKNEINSSRFAHIEEWKEFPFTAPGLCISLFISIDRRKNLHNKYSPKASRLSNLGKFGCNPFRFCWCAFDRDEREEKKFAWK